jgi:hypothetical protein
MKCEIGTTESKPDQQNSYSALRPSDFGSATRIHKHDIMSCAKTEAPSTLTLLQKKMGATF